jgi:hypothetical protein
VAVILVEWGKGSIVLG